MLDISNNSEKTHIEEQNYRSFRLFKENRPTKVLAQLLLIFLGVFILILFLPWTQNIRGNGKVTALNPGERPQTLHAVIGGQIAQWYVQEGDFVQKGDTIIRLTEVKDDYFDPNLVLRTGEQVKSKELALKAYDEKVSALNTQIKALQETQQLKAEQASNYLKQAKLKVKSDSVDLQAAEAQYEIAFKQFQRQEQLYKEGLKSLTDLEQKRLKWQETLAKKISAENKWLASQNELINARIELSSLKAQYQDKLSKAASDKFSTLSSLYDAEAQLSKMQNQLANYTIRNGMYYVTAPQSGYITQAIKTGMGETIKAGEPLLSIMPSDYQLAVEMYVAPMDLPLLHKDQPVRLVFDGWPAIVFSGWPNASTGTFGGKIVAIDNFVSKGGKYRILIAQDSTEMDWPEALRVGSGAYGMILLNNVAIGYEMWRQLNGFPPDFYADMPANAQDMKKDKK